MDFFNEYERVGVFIDAANNYMGLKGSDLSVDYAALLKSFRENCRLVSIRYYSGASSKPEHRSIKVRLDWLTYHGFTVVSKPIKILPDKSIKANMDIELAVDVMTMYPKLDHVVLFTGDSDFRYLIETIQKFGLTVTVVSMGSHLSDELKRQADHCVDLDEIINNV